MNISRKTKLISTAVLLSSVTFISYTLYAGTESGTGKIDLSTDKSKLNYTIGVEMGRQFGRTEFEFDSQALLQGIQDGQGGTPQLTDEEMQKVRVDYQKIAMEKMQKHQEKLAEDNLKESNAFFETNKGKPGIVQTDSGLQYKIIKEGQGTMPTEQDVVTVQYVGKTLDGKEFDSSYKRNQPAKLQLNYVIPGWKEALKLMKPGSKWEVYIPPQLAYGKAGAGQMIEPNSALIFDIELVSVEPKKVETKQETPAQTKPEAE